MIVKTIRNGQKEYEEKITKKKEFTAKRTNKIIGK